MAGGNSDSGAGGDFKSKPGDNSNATDNQGEETGGKGNEYLRSLLAEKLAIDQEKFPISTKLLDIEISRVQTEGRGTKKDQKLMNVYRDKPVKIACKVLVPLKEHPKFNFMGKLLGPKGSSLKRLQEDTMCKMAILGRGSMKDKDKEEEFRKSLEFKYAHLLDDMHVEVTALAPPAEAYARIAFALTELRKYLIPDNIDDIDPRDTYEGPKGRAGGGPPALLKRPMRGPPQRPGPPGRAPPGNRGAPGPRGGPGPRGMSGDAKVMSILGRVRSGMEPSYDAPYDEPYEPEAAYDDYPPPAPPQRPGFGGNRFASSDYDEYYGESRNSYEDNQRWKPVKTGGAAARPFAPRYRSTPYSRGGK